MAPTWRTCFTAQDASAHGQGNHRRSGQQKHTRLHVSWESCAPLPSTLNYRAKFVVGARGTFLNDTQSPNSSSTGKRAKYLRKGRTFRSLPCVTPPPDASGHDLRCGTVLMVQTVVLLQSAELRPPAGMSSFLPNPLQSGRQIVNLSLK